MLLEVIGSHWTLLNRNMTWSDFRKISFKAKWRKDWSKEKLGTGRPISKLLQ